MKKLPSTLKNMILSLTLISFFMATALGIVYTITKDPIKKSELSKINNSLAQVLPEFDNNPYNEKTIINEDIEIFPAKKGDKIVGYAVKTVSHKGFSGDIVLIVGFLPDGTINNISVLQQKETPGLGTKMSEPKFKNQFINKNPSQFKLSVKKDGGDVDAITASTITSRAFCEAVQKAYDALNDFKNK